MVKEFNNLEEIQKYYDEEMNTYIFEEDGKFIDVILNFDLNIEANIISFNIKAWDIFANNIHTLNINAHDIKAHNISAWDINANNINAFIIFAHKINAYNINAEKLTYVSCSPAFENIICNSIKGKREGTKHFVFDGKLEVKNNG